MPPNGGRRKNASNPVHTRRDVGVDGGHHRFPAGILRQAPGEAEGAARFQQAQPAPHGVRGAGQELDHVPGQDHIEPPGRERRVLGVAARNGDGAQPAGAGLGCCGVQHRAGQVDGVDAAGGPGEAGGGEGDRAFPAAHVQDARARPYLRLVHEPGAHGGEELGAARVVPGGGLGEPGDHLMLDRPRQRLRRAHRVISPASAVTFTDGTATATTANTAVTLRGRMRVDMTGPWGDAAGAQGMLGVTSS